MKQNEHLDTDQPSDHNNNHESVEVNSSAQKGVDSEPEINPIKMSILLRARVFYALFLVIALSSLGMIIYYQFGSQSDQLRAQSIEYSFKTEIIEAARGDILSDNKNTLVTSVVYYDLRIDLMAQGLSDKLFDKDVGALAKGLSEFFKDKSASAYLQGLRVARSEKKRYYRLGNRRVDYLELQQLKQLPILNLPPNQGGFIPQEMGKRVNPYGDLAGRTLGFVNKVGVKVGLEGWYDNVLKGSDGLTVKQKISGNFWIPIVSDNNIEPQNGQDIVTTLNVEMQNNVQRSLYERVSAMEADWGCVIVMEVQTGHIKAISNVTRLKSGKLVEDYNYAIGMSLEPGSTFKVATLMTLLEDGKVSLSERFDTEDGDAQVGYAKVVDTKTGGYGVLTLSEVIEKSSNIGVAKAVNKYYGSRPSRFVECLSSYGFNKPLGLEISGESKPILKHPNMRNGWDGMTLVMMSYGYALRISPIQTLAFYNAIANDGKLVKPQLVTSIESQGRTIKEFETQVLNERICSPTTLKNVQGVLERVVLQGTAKSLKNDNYSVAAKTGTAQIAMGRSGYKTASGARHYMGSLAGYFPADKPKYSIIVVLKTFWEPGSNKAYYGGQLGGPLFKEIADDIFNADLSLVKANRVDSARRVVKRSELTFCLDSVDRLEKVAKSVRIGYPKREMVIKTDSVGVPSMIGVSPSLAQKELWNLGYDVVVEGRGRIYDQFTKFDTLKNRRVVVLKLR